MARRFLLVSAFVFYVLVAPSRSAAAQDANCLVTVREGGDISAAVASAAAGAQICLENGVYPPFVAGQRTAPGVTVRALSSGAVIERGDPSVLIDGASRFTLASVAVRGGIVARRATGLTLASLRIDDSEIGVLLDGGSAALLDGVTVGAPQTAGLVVRDAVVTADLTIDDAGGYGVAVLDGGALTLRGAISGGTAAAVFAGRAGCAELPLASSVLPDCVAEDPDGAIGDSRLTVDGLAIGPGAGAGVIIHPGAAAALRGSTIAGRQRGGLRAWGAGVEAEDLTISDSAVVGIELLGYPDPRGVASLRAVARLSRVTVRGTLALDGGLLGDGLVARAADVTVEGSALEANDGAGTVLRDGATAIISDSTAANNGGPAVCVGADSALAARNNRDEHNALVFAACEEE